MNLYEPPKKILIASILMLFLSLLMFAVFGFVLFSKLVTVSVGISETRSASKGVEQAFTIKTETNEFRDEISAIESFFIGSGGEVSFIEKVESLASTSDIAMTVKNVSIEGKSPIKFAETLKLAIECEGSRDSLISLIKSLEGMPHPIVIENIVLATKAEGGVWGAQINLSAYKMKD